MTIKYHWENVVVNELQFDTLEPRTKKVVKDIDYEYEVNVKAEDVIDYLMPVWFGKDNNTQEHIIENGYANTYLTKMFNYLVHNCSIDLDDLENDEYFVQYMKERYEDIAYEEWEESNEEY